MKTGCSKCGDTHRMAFEDREVPCTFCPRPCKRCRGLYQGVRVGAYCETTPCPCGCHPLHARILVRRMKMSGIDCDGQIVDELEVYVSGRTRRVAILGYHHDDSKARHGETPWDYYHVEEIVALEGGGTELVELAPDPLPERPGLSEIKVLLEAQVERSRTGMLASIARDLAKLASAVDVKLWRVEVVLLDADGVVLAVGPLTSVMGWITDGIHQTPDLIDISCAESAHVQLREQGVCLTCGGREHCVAG